MPQSKQIAWTQLRVGLLVLTSLVIFGVLVFLMTGEGFLSRKYRLRTYMDNAGGLRVGDPVRLTGIDAGNVDEIRVSGSHDPKRAVEVLLKIQRRYQQEIRSDSQAELEAEGLLGQRFLNITRGTPIQPIIPEDGEVKFFDRPELREIVGRSADVVTNLNEAVLRVNRIMEAVEQGKGSLGKIIYDDALYQKATRTVDEANKLIAYASSGRGSLGRFLMTDELYDGVRGTTQRLDQVVADVQAGKGSLGKFLYDTALYDRAVQVTARADSLLTEVDKGRGSLGKFIKDEALYNRANSTVDSLDKIAARLEKGQGSAGKFLHDEALYNNVNTFSLELRSLIADFRKNPKKFLTINFKLF